MNDESVDRGDKTAKKDLAKKKGATAGGTTPRHMRNPAKVAIIDEKLLDMSAEEFRDRLKKSQVSARQFSKLTDITRARIQRVSEGERMSLVEREPGVFVVPRIFAVVLLAIESGLLVVGDESM